MIQICIAWPNCQTGFATGNSKSNYNAGGNQITIHDASRHAFLDFWAQLELIFKLHAYIPLKSCVMCKITLLMENFHRRNQLDGISFLNVQTLPESPTQDGTDAILSFYVNLPSGTMRLELLSTIFLSNPNIIAHRNLVTPSANPRLRDDQIENLVELNSTTEVNTLNFCNRIVIWNELSGYNSTRPPRYLYICTWYTYILNMFK